MAKLDRISEAFEPPQSVDREAGVIRGVKLLGFVSKNGRRYSEAAVRKAASLYEGKVINLNHVGKGQARDVRDLAGAFSNIRVEEGKGLFGDVRYLKGDPAGEKFATLAEAGFSNVGMSHDADGRMKRIGNENVVEEITAVNSVDVVFNPATTQSFKEHTMTKTTLRKLIEATPYKYTAKLLEMLPELAAEEPIDAPEMPETDSAPDPVDAVAAALGAKVLDAIKDPDVDDAAVGAMAKAASKTVASVRADMEPKAEKPADAPSDPPADEKTTEAVIAKAIAKANAPLLEKLEAVAKRDDARSILESKGAQVTAQLLEELTACPDRKAMEALVDGWTPAKLGKSKPAIGSLRESSDEKYPEQTKDFVRALKRS